MTDSRFFQAKILVFGAMAVAFWLILGNLPTTYAAEDLDAIVMRRVDKSASAANTTTSARAPAAVEPTRASQHAQKSKSGYCDFKANPKNLALTDNEQERRERRIEP